MVEITRWGVKLDTPYGKLELRFGCSNLIAIPEEDVKTSVARKKFAELAKKIRDGKLSREEFDLLRKISDLPAGWEKSRAAGNLLEAGTEKELEGLREDVNSKLEEARDKRQQREEFRQVWKNVEEKGYYIRRYRGSKPRYLIICGEHRRSFYVIQLPPEYDFKIYPGKTSSSKTLGRRLKKSPSKLIGSYHREERAIQDLQDDSYALSNLWKALEGLPEPQKSELGNRLVALRLTGAKK